MNDAKNPGTPVHPLRDPLNLLALAFLLAWGIVALNRPIGDYGVETDFYGDFARYAREWARGEPSLMNGFRGPVYYLLLAGFEKLHVDLFAVAKFFSVICGALAVRLSGGLLRRLFGSAAGIAGALVVAANPVMVTYAPRACSDVFYFALFAAVLLLMFRKENPAPADWAAAGALAGIAYLTRYNGLVLLPAALATAAIRFGPRRAFRAALAFAVPLCVVSLPWWIYTAHEVGNPFWNNAWQNVAISLLGGNTNVAQSGGFLSDIRFSSLLDVWRVSPPLFLAGMAGNVIEHARGDAMDLAGPVWALAAVAGVLLNVRGRLRRDTIAFAVIGIFVWITLLPVFYNARFMLTLVLWWGAAAAGVAAWAARRVETAPPETRAAKRGRSVRSGGPRWVAPAVLVAFLAAALVPTWRGIAVSRTENGEETLPTEILAVAREARRLGVPVGPDTPIAARKPHIGYYLNAPVLPIPLGDSENMRRAGAHYLLVSGIEAAIYPSLRSMWAPRSADDVGAGFRPVAVGVVRQPSGRDRRATLYAVEDPIPWSPPPRSNPKPGEEPPPPGLSRIDFLRLKLARWYLRFDLDIKPEAMFSRMSEAALDHPEVIPVRAGAAWVAGRKDDAKALYERALRANPGDARTLYCLAGLARERGDDDRYRALMDGIAGADTTRDAGLAFHAAQAREYMRVIDYIPALAPDLYYLDAHPDSQWALMGLAYIQQAMHRKEDAIATLTRFLQLYPGDLEAQSLIRSIKEAMK